MPYVSKAWLARAGLTSVPGYTPIGEHHKTGDILYVSDAERETGTYILGSSGYGKSGLLENMAVRDILAGERAVVFIDYHGDTALHIIAATPPEHQHRIYLFDLTDDSWPISLNLFTRDNLESGTSVRIAVNRILHLFNALWPETQTQMNLPNFVRAAVMTLLANEDTTLYDFYRMFTDAAYRHKLVANVPWDNVKDYWRQYDALSQMAREERGAAILNRLHALFMGDPLMANVLGQAPGRIDFKQVIANREVVIVKLPGRTMEYESRLVGGILLAQLQAAVFSGDRSPASVFIDEFQAIATPDIQTFFTEGRKYRIALTIAHQIRSQVSKDLQDASIAAKTIVCFRTQLDDSRALAPLFASSRSAIKPEDVERHACQRLMDDGSPAPIVQAFVDYYLRPLNGYRRGTRIEITTRGFSMRDSFLEVGSALNGTYDPNAPRPKVDDPVPWLDDLFRRCMETRSPNIPIPILALAGFANEGPGFWPQVRRLKENDPILQPGYVFPDDMVVKTAGGEVWAKDLHTGRDQMLHCIFVIRAVMDWLANNPIGKESTASDKELGQILRSLPKRACAVRSGDDQGILFTLDNYPHVTDSELKQRIAAILERTHDTYCRPRHEVEAARQPKPSMPQSRWEQR